MNFRRCILPLALLLTLVLAVQPVLGQATPDVTPEATAEAGTANASPITQLSEGVWQVPLEHLTGVRDVRLTGQVAQRDVFLPVPQGMTPRDLRAGVLVSPDVQSGYVEARSGDTTLIVHDIASASPTIDIPLQDAVIQDGQIKLTLVARLRSSDDVCTTNLLGAWLALQSPVYLLDGAETPATTVGNFLPPILTKLTLHVPAQPTMAEAEAALRAAAAIAQRYPTQKVQIALNPATAAAPAPFERTITIKEDDAAKSSLMSVDANGALVLTGDAKTLPQQSQFLAQTPVALVDASAGSVLNITDSTQLSSAQMSFDQLGKTNLQVTGVGRIELPITFSQSEFGGPIQNVSVRLVGRYTPISATDRGVLSIYVNSVLLGSIPLGGQGEFDTTVSVPGTLLQRDNTLVAQYDYVPAGGNCDIAANSFTGQILGSSTIQFTRGQGLPAGFERFPQTFAPVFVVAFEPLTPEALNGGITLVSELQRLSTAPLNPHVVSLADATASAQSALLVTSATTDVASFAPPLQTKPLRVVDASGAEVLKVDADTALTTLQAFEQKGRSLLLLQYASNPAPLVSALEADTRGWYGLQGDIAVASDTQPLVNLRLRESTLTVEAQQPAEQPVWVKYQPVIYVIVVIVVLALVALTYPRVVRRKPIG